MLSLQLHSGDYLTIGENVVVQVFSLSGGFVRVAVKAPREVPILRSKVLERTEARPEGLHEKRTLSPSDRARKAKNLEQMASKKEFFTARRAAIAEELKKLGSRLDTCGRSDAEMAEIRSCIVKLAQEIENENVV